MPVHRAVNQNIYAPPLAEHQIALHPKVFGDLQIQGPGFPHQGDGHPLGNDELVELIVSARQFTGLQGMEIQGGNGQGEGAEQPAGKPGQVTHGKTPFDLVCGEAPGKSSPHLVSGILAAWAAGHQAAQAASFSRAPSRFSQAF